MKTPHLCWVVESPSCFEPLVEAARVLGLRVGWLHLAPSSPSPELEPARRAGLSRSVAVGGGTVLDLRAVAGEPVLRDLIRGHFLGCRLVLLSGDPANPGVRIDPELELSRLWRVRGAAPADEQGAIHFKLVTGDGRQRVLPVAELAERLRRPRL